MKPTYSLKSQGQVSTSLEHINAGITHILRVKEIKFIKRLEIQQGMQPITS